MNLLKSGEKVPMEMKTEREEALAVTTRGQAKREAKESALREQEELAAGRGSARNQCQPFRVSRSTTRALRRAKGKRTERKPRESEPSLIKTSFQVVENVRSYLEDRNGGRDRHMQLRYEVS